MEKLGLGDLLVLERQGWDALCTQTGGSFYSSIMTEQALMILVNGAVMDKTSVVSSLDHAPAWDTYKISDVQRVILGDAAAVLVYRATAQREGEDVFEALMTSTYVLEGGSVKLALYTQTTATH